MVCLEISLYQGDQVWGHQLSGGFWSQPAEADFLSGLGCGLPSPG